MAVITLADRRRAQAEPKVENANARSTTLSLEEWLSLGDQLPMPRSRDLAFDLLAHVSPSLVWDHPKRWLARYDDRHGEAA